MFKQILLIMIITLSLQAQTIISEGLGSNSDKIIAKERALTDAKVQALNSAGVQISAELEIKDSEDIDGFKSELKSKILQHSEGLVSLLKIIDIGYSKNHQIYNCTLKAKFNIKKSDIKNSFEIMRKLKSLEKSSVGRDEYKKLLDEIKYLKNSIKSPQLSTIVNKHTHKIINKIDVQNDIVNNIAIRNDNKIINKNNISLDNKIENKIKIENRTDNLLYFIIGGLFLIIIILLFLFTNRKKELTYEDIADRKRADDNITLSLDKSLFSEGEKLSINFKIDSPLYDLYIYAYNIDDNKEIVFLDLIENDKIVSNKEYRFPTWSDGYDVSAPFGDDIIKIFISDKPIKKPILEDRESEVFISSNSRGLSNTTIQKELSQKEKISKFDVVAYYRGFSDKCEIFEKSIAYRTVEKI